MIYLLPRADVMGNFPVWSENINFLVASNTIRYTCLCVLLPGFCCKPSIASLSNIFVDLTPYFVCFMWPFWVSSDSGKCREMFSGVMPGNVTRLPCWAAVSNVALVGVPNAAWRNLTTSFVFGFLYTLIAVSATSMFWLIVVSSVTGTIHNPLLSRHPWRAGGMVHA